MVRIRLARLARCMTTTGTLADTTTVRWLGLATALASTITGGTLFAFSTFVMPGLRRLPADRAVAAMQAINVQAPRSLLMVPLLGSALGGAILVVLVVTRPDTPHRALLIAGGALAVLTLVITGAYHVPHNDALARLHPGASTTAPAWTHYYRGWMAWNHVRTATAIASGATLVAACWPRTAGR